MSQSSTLATTPQGLALAALDVFAKVVKICHYGFRIYSFRSTWPCLMIEILVTWMKFHMCSFIFHTTNVFHCFHINMAQLKLIMHISCTFICAVFKSHIVKQYTMYQCTPYHDTTNHSRYLPWVELLLSFDMHIPKYCEIIKKNFICSSLYYSE